MDDTHINENTSKEWRDSIAVELLCSLDFIPQAAVKAHWMISSKIYIRRIACYDYVRRTTYVRTGGRFVRQAAALRPDRSRRGGIGEPPAVAVAVAPAFAAALVRRSGCHVHGRLELGGVDLAGGVSRHRGDVGQVTNAVHDELGWRVTERVTFAGGWGPRGMREVGGICCGIGGSQVFRVYEGVCVSLGYAYAA